MNCLQAALSIGLLSVVSALACGGSDGSAGSDVVGGLSNAGSGGESAGAGGKGGAPCGAPPPVEPPAGCDPTRSWARLPGSNECVVVFGGCVPQNTDQQVWMTFSRLVECQAITCKAGDIRPAGDGCNTCTCKTQSSPGLDGGYWSCTNEACGAAAPTGEACGFFEGACGAGEFCAFSPIDGCSQTDAPSICISQPSECTGEDAPVCGCNGTNYPNRCEAARAGTGILDFGPCPRLGGPVACGARAGATCTDAEYCAYAAGAWCGAADAEATCRPRPAACLPVDAPVCACDGKTYANACEAARSGVGVRSEGACCQ